MTGTFESSGRFQFLDAETVTFATAAALEVGQEVIVSGNMVVGLRDGATQRSIGVVGTKPDDGFVTIRNAIFDDVIIAKAKGGTLNAGALVRQDGTVDSTTKLPNYIATTTGNLASGIVLSGGSAGADIRIGVLKTSIVV